MSAKITCKTKDRLNLNLNKPKGLIRESWR